MRVQGVVEEVIAFTVQAVGSDLMRCISKPEHQYHFVQHMALAATRVACSASLPLMSQFM